MREATTGPLPSSGLHSPDDRLAEALLRQLLPFVAPPEGELPDADEVAALIEGRLRPADVERLIRRIDGSAAARSELARLSPRIYARHFPEQKALGRTMPKYAKVLSWTGVAALAAALLAAFVLPYSAPEGASLTVRIQPVERGATPAPAGAMRPNQWATLQLSAGTIGVLDEARGASPWVTLYEVAPNGQRTRLCSSADSSCALVGGRVPLSWKAPSEEGTYFLILLAGSHDPLAADSLEGPGGRVVLEAAALEAGWVVSTQVLEVRR